MKKFLCLVLLILLMGISAVAEDNADFAFIGNVRFGMTINEVEKALGIKVQQWDAEMAIAYKNNLGITNPKYLYLKDITIAGYDG